ncbi:OmpP1/FadL family transporter [Shimia abyssi]|uniref:Long-subunit fatty acid transport protein n=1 Tax=Shimia abyssi TaxID=1662395 RepID=A0A2P8F6M4_9RHOB|nr:transporter [Shimia abyssi]PSL17367.1 long-subunit fatty acid transport protein [Shimia abyssi]
MKKMLMGASALAMVGGASYAGGLDRSGQGINIIFEEGTVAQFGYSYVDPSVTGTFAGTNSGDVGEAYGLPQLSFKTAFTETLDFALIYDRPFGAHVNYDSGYRLSIDPVNPGTPNNLTAEAEAQALTAILRQKLNNGFSVYGGLRIQNVDTSVNVPAVAGYNVQSDSPTDFGYLLGASWEKPEIAARVSLTYNSKIKHSLQATETNSLGTNVTSPVGIATPQSVNLDFQTGVAPNTLVFGTVRWVNWSDFDYTPPVYLGATGGSLVSYDDDVITYTLGVGHRFNESFSGAIQLGYEQSEGNLVSNLGPTDGFWSLGVGGTYTNKNVQYSAGVRYIDIGDAVTNVGGNPGGTFNGNSGWAAGFQITYHFDKNPA